MGRCKMCCDPKLEQRKLRKQRKEEFKYNLKKEKISIQNYYKNHSEQDIEFDRDDNEIWIL